MNRRGFLRGFGLLVASVALAPAIDLLAEPETPCGGLIWQIQNSGTTVPYEPLTIAKLEEVLRILESQPPAEHIIYFSKSTYEALFGKL